MGRCVGLVTVRPAIRLNNLTFVFISRRIKSVFVESPSTRHVGIDEIVFSSSSPVMKCFWMESKSCSAETFVSCTAF